jgi:glycerate dehydrogenase
MKITFLDVKTVGRLAELENLEKLGEVDIYMTTKPNETFRRIKDSDIVITNKVVLDRKIISRCTKLKLICVAATGTNNIDLEAAKEKGVAVKNVKGYSTDSVAQHTFAMLFYLINNLAFYDKLVKSKKYSSGQIFTNLDREIGEIKGKRFGIIGLGEIGEKVGYLARAFGSDVFYYSTSGSHNHSLFTRLELNELLSTSDIISIHAPLNDKTKNLISLGQLLLMKKTSILINTGRGGIVNEKDLAKALNKNLISGAAIDVFEKEPISKTHPLLQVKNKEKIVLTPHIAWSSIEARKTLLQRIYANIQDFMNK